MLNSIRKLLTLNLTGLVFTLVSCSAYDLSKAGNFYYPPNNPDAPIWEDNINNIVLYKCGSCHTPATPWFKPSNTPAQINTENPNFSLERITLEAFFDEKNQEKMRIIKKCIEDVCGTEGIPMPPNFASQLSPEEKTGLINFVNKFIVQSESNLSAFFQENCSLCHGDDGKSKGSSTQNKQIGESQSDTFEKYKNAYTTLAPMPNYSSGYSDSDAENDWKIITGN
jgi:cytochrome c551/c552